MICKFDCSLGKVLVVERGLKDAGREDDFVLDGGVVSIHRGGRHAPAKTNVVRQVHFEANSHSDDRLGEEENTTNLVLLLKSPTAVVMMMIVMMMMMMMMMGMIF